MQLSRTLSWLVDSGAESGGPDRLLAELGARLAEDGVPVSGGALTLNVPHPLIARRAWLWRADGGEVVEALGFASAGPFAASPSSPASSPARRWLTRVAAGPVHEDSISTGKDGDSLAWVGPRSFSPSEVGALTEAARFAAAPIAALTARATLSAALEAYLGRRTAARVLAAPLRRDVGETIDAALLYADLRGFTELSERSSPDSVLSALNAWFDRIAGAVHAFGGEVLKFIGDGILAIFPVGPVAPRAVCDAALRAASAARSGMTYLDGERRQQGLPPLPFGVALHLGQIFWGNIGAADRLDFTAIGPAVNLVSRLEGLCRPLGHTVLASGAVASETKTRLLPLGAHVLRGIARPCEVFALPEP